MPSRPRALPSRAPTLVDGDVRLRAHAESDVPGVVEQCLDPLSRRWTTVPLDYSADRARQFVRHVMPGGWAGGEEWGFAVDVVDDQGRPRFAGTVSLRPEGDRRAELAFGAHPWARGRGVMQRAVRLLLGWGFEEQGLETVVWWANRGNWASRRLAWRLGFRLEGEVRRWLPQRGALLDGWVGTLLAEDPREPAHPWHDVPRLTSEGLVLRRHRPDDVPRIVEACRDPLSQHWLGMLPRDFAAGHAEEWLESRLEQQARGTGVDWAVADPATDLLLGSVSLFDVVRGDGHGEATIGYWLHAEGRGRGLATQACRLASRHAFVPDEDGGLGLDVVRAAAAVGNADSHDVLDRAGFVRQGRSARLVRTADGVSDAYLFDLVRR